MDYIEISAKTVNDAITEACQKLGITSDKLEYEVVEEGSAGFLGFNSKKAIIKAKEKVIVETKEEKVLNFLNEVFHAMKLEVSVLVKYHEEEKTIDIDLSGEEMGVLIGKRGQTLDSIQYLVSLVVNKNNDDYFTNSRLTRDTMYSQMIESYQKILNNTSVSADQKAISQTEIKKINDLKNSIMICENLIKTKGISDVVIFANDTSISVIIKTNGEEVTKEQAAQIQNIVAREMKAEIENIHISNK